MPKTSKISMTLYGRSVSSDILGMAMMHMRNKGNRSGSFTKESVERYLVNELGVPEVEQARDARGRFSHNVDTADRLADRLMQKLVKLGRLTKLHREGNTTHWKWIPERS